jgi:hypothetical protein
MLKVTDEVVGKRLVGIARYWQKRFHLPYQSLDDLIQSAWMLWLERPTVETERRFTQVYNGVRRVILVDIFGVCPRNGKVKTADVPKFVSSDYIGGAIQDFDSSVRVLEIVNKCAVSKAYHLNTLKVICGTRPMPKRRIEFTHRQNRLRRFLRDHGLAA